MPAPTPELADIFRQYGPAYRRTHSLPLHQLRLMQAMRLLGGGAKVTYAALEAGYSTSSAFIAAFRKTLGSTPTRYFRDPSGS